jgi:hypothetical protein
MESVEIARCHVEVALTALVDNFLPEICLVDSLDRVRLVAITARGERLLGVVCEPAVDAAPELLGDSQVAIAARACDVFGIHRRIGIAGWEFTVC